MCVRAPAGAHGVQYVCTRMLLSSRVYTVLCWNGEHVLPSASPWERTSFVLASFAWFIIAPEMNKGEGMCVYMWFACMWGACEEVCRGQPRVVFLRQGFSLAYLASLVGLQALGILSLSPRC